MINQNHLILLSFAKRRDTEGEGIILVDNPAGHCFVLSNLIPINFTKYIMIVKLKMGAAGKIFGEICF